MPDFTNGFEHLSTPVALGVAGVTSRYSFFDAVMAARGVPGSQKLLLGLLAWRADSQGRCVVRIADLAELAGTSRSTVSRALNELETSGLIERVRRTTAAGADLPSLYMINISLLASMNPDLGGAL